MLLQVATGLRLLRLSARRTGLCRRLYAAASDEDNSRPPIIPFDDMLSDFARDDIPLPRAAAQGTVVERTPPPPSPQKSSSKVVVNPSGWIEDPSRPTGYGRPDLDDDEDEMQLKMIEDKWLPPADESGFQKWFRETYVGSPYDSRKKKQARLVIINITFISVAIGVVFAGVWLLFPGKFISIRGDRDFTARYATDFVAPEGLLNEEWQRSKVSPNDAGRYFDDAVGLPLPEQTRFGEVKQPSGAGLSFAPPPRADL